MVPKSDIEKALVYSGINREGSVSTDVGQEYSDQKRSAYESVLDKVESPERLIDLQLRLSEDLPYLQMTSDEAITDHFSRFGVPITSKKDLEIFSYVLAERINSLDESDEEVRMRLNQITYQTNLRKLPQVMSKLERTLSDFDALKEPFESVIRYVWEQVTFNGFRMREEGEKATEPYSGKLDIRPVPEKSVQVSMNLGDEDKLEFFIHPKFKKIIVPGKKRRFWFDDFDEIKETEELEALEILPTHIFDKYYTKNIESGFPSKGRKKDVYVKILRKVYLEEGVDKNKLIIFDPSEMINEWAESALENPDRYTGSFQTYFKTIFNLPRLMNNYFQRVESSMRNVLDNTLENQSEE